MLHIMLVSDFDNHTNLWFATVLPPCCGVLNSDKSQPRCPKKLFLVVSFFDALNVSSAISRFSNDIGLGKWARLGDLGLMGGG